MQRQPQDPAQRLLFAPTQRGAGLMEALVALAILAFGLLGMTRLQTRTLAATTEAQQRFTAQQLGDELLSSALVDTANSACYTLPAAGVCNSTRAREQTNAWGARVAQVLPGPGSATVALGAAGRLTATLNWTGRESQAARTLVVSTDVR